MEKYTWDLSKIFDTTEDFNNSISFLEKEIDNFSNNFKNKVLDSGEHLFDAITKYEDLNNLLSKIYVYAYLNYYACTLEEINQKLVSQAERIVNKFEEKLSWYDIEINKITEEKYFDLKKENKKLELYDFFIENIFRKKKHKLSDIEENLLSKLGLCFNNSDSIFSKLDNSDATFENIVLDGKVYDLNHSTYGEYITSEDRNLRKQTFINYFNYYKKHKNTLAENYISFVKSSNKICQIKKYKGTLDASLYSDNIDIKVFERIVETVNKNIPMLKKYISLKAADLNVDDYNYYDLYYKKKDNIEYDYNYGKELVLNACAPFGDKYKNILNRAFDERWIDVYYKKGKRNGAFSWGTYDTNPYLLLNYKNDYDSVSTLAHELGHSVNKELSKKQLSLYSDNCIFLAEIASTVNELMLANYVLDHSSSKQEKKNIVVNILEHFRTTIFRQILFTEFENEVFNMDLNDEDITEPILSNLYLNLVRKYYGDIGYFDEIKYEWSRIPHFYTPFYVYKYATGMSIACVIVNRILNNEKNAVENYITFLESGSKDYPLEILKNCGYDLRDDEIFDEAMKLFEKFIKSYEELI